MTELAALWTPLADRVVKGERVAAAELKGVDQVVAKYVAAAPRVPSFLTEYLPVFKVREDIFASDVKAAKAKTKEDAILDRILQGKPKSAGKVSRQPAAEATTSDTGGERRRDPAQLVPGGGRPLRRDTRAMMEARMGRDFGGVRVHDDAEAAASADALQADAYTVGRDMVFAEGKNAPETPEGRELLGHELAHVAQQGAAGPTAPAGAPGAAGPREDRLPVVLEEPVTIPDTIPVEKPKDESPAMPPAPGEREAPHPAAPVVALSRSAGAGATLADVVPADHPSEREAAAIGRRVAGRDGGHHDLVGETAGGPVHRQPAAGAPVKQRLDLVFFMGHRDKPGNPFYANARAYFKTHVKTDLTIDNDKYRSLAGVFAYLRSFDPARPIGNIYLVSHANEDGTLSFPLEPGDADRRTSYGELKAAVKDRPELFALPFGLIDRQTVVHIKGCNIGRSTEMLNKLDESFGGRGLVTAPTHKQSYGTEKVGRTPAVRYEALSTYFLEYSGPTTKTRAEQLAEFKARYPQIPDKRWATLLPRAGAKRDVVAFKFSYANAADVGEALAKARAFGEDNFTRPEVYVWRVVSKKKTKTGVNVDLVAEKTNYTIAGVIEDENRKRLVPDESDPRYFGKSTYAPTPTAAALRLEPAKMTTPALMGRISEIDAELAAPQALADEGRKKEAEFEQRTMQAELGRRKIAVDVKVVKTEDWLGADEVYVRASRGGMAVKTGVHKLNDGQQRVYTVPLLSFLPLDAPIRFEVYDEDWPDKDDLIVRMDWRPPYAPLQNSESYDKADYRVNVRFER
ncbi:MAG: DUF4157 domain-containing protein [Chloroflexi bacterium]|nr:DUF4157 domain-containing protein [Chloroflexota bacterium]